jgi:CRISPR system CASCADE complex protein casB
MSELNIYHFVQHIIRQAKRKQESRDSQAVREIAALRSGMSITTEYRAYPYVLPYLGDASQQKQKRVVALRCAAMIAEYADLGADSDDASPLRFGVWANQLARKIGDDDSVDGMIASRLEYLHTQDVEEAITTIRRILQYAQSAGFTQRVDFIQLFKTFWYWGNGYNNDSLNRRLQILRDFYGTLNPVTTN